MQISSQETLRAALRPRTHREPNGGKVRNVEELARKYGVDAEEARDTAQRALLQEEDPLRAKRVRELAARVASGEYQVDGEQVVDMAERRAIADRIR